MSLIKCVSSWPPDGALFEFEVSSMLALVFLSVSQKDLGSFSVFSN